MKKEQIAVLAVGVAVAISVVLIGEFFFSRNLEPLAKVETELKNFEGGPGQRLLEIRALVDNVLEPESDVYISWESGPEQPDEPDDVTLIPGGWAYYGNGYRWENGKLVNPYGFEPIEERTVSFETEIGEVAVRYRDNVTMAPGEREVVIFYIRPDNKELRELHDGDLSIEARARGTQMLVLDNGIRRDVYRFDVAVKVEGLGEVGIYPLTITVEEGAYYPP